MGQSYTPLSLHSVSIIDFFIVQFILRKTPSPTGLLYSFRFLLRTEVTTLGIWNPLSYFTETSITYCNGWQGPLLAEQHISLQQRFLPNLKISEFTGEPEIYDDLYFLPQPQPPADITVLGPFHSLKFDLHPATRIPENMMNIFV